MHASSRSVMILLVLCYVMWGGGMIALKYALESFSVIQIVFARVFLPAVFYIVIFPLWRRLPYERGDWKYLFLLVLFEPILFFLFETFALKFTSASQGGVIAACFPVCTAVAAWFFLKEKLSHRTMSAIVLAVLGVACTSYFAGASEGAPAPLLGNALMIGAVLSSSAYAVTVRYISRRYSFLSISAIQAIGGSLAFSPLLAGESLPSCITFASLGGLLYMGVCVGILVYLGFNFSLQHLEAGVVALFGNLIPVFSLFFAYILLGERLNPQQAAGVALTLFGVLMATTGNRNTNGGDRD